MRTPKTLPPGYAHETGVLLAEFAPPTLGQLAALLAAKETCRHLVLGVLSPEGSLEDGAGKGPGASESATNSLLSFDERHVLLRDLLDAEGVDPFAYSVVPLPLAQPVLYKFYLPQGATLFLPSEDDPHFVRLAAGLAEEAQAEGFALVEIATSVPEFPSEAEVRARLMAGENWRELVPALVAERLTALGIPGRS